MYEALQGVGIDTFKPAGQITALLLVQGGVELGDDVLSPGEGIVGELDVAVLDAGLGAIQKAQGASKQEQEQDQVGAAAGLGLYPSVGSVWGFSHHLSHCYRAILLILGLLIKSAAAGACSRPAGVTPQHAGPSLHQVGAALLAYAQAAKLEEGFGPYRLEDVYLGTEYGGDEIRSAVEGSGEPFAELEAVEPFVAKLPAGGKVVGWFDGAIEYGPRALGSRSILAAPEIFENYEEGSFAAEFMTVTFDGWSPFVLSGGLVLFHDANNPEIGPFQVIGEILEAGDYRELPGINSLRVCKRWKPGSDRRTRSRRLHEGRVATAEVWRAFAYENRRRDGGRLTTISRTHSCQKGN